MKCKFEELLVGHQEDLKRIIGKHLSKTLHIKVDDVVSVTNQQLLSTKDKFFDRFGYNFTKADFGKWAYNYARNLTKWQAIRYLNKDEKLQDGTFYSDEGEKSLFEVVSEQQGEENKDLEKFDADTKVKVIENIIKEYSHLLAAGEKEVFSGLLHGKTELEIAESQNVTRQAVNLTKARVFDKIRHAFVPHLNVDDVSVVSGKNRDESLEIVGELINKVEARRLRYDSKRKSSKENLNLYVYAIE